MYANGGNNTAAYRSLATGSVPVGGTFKIDMDNGLIDTGQFRWVRLAKRQRHERSLRLQYERAF